MIHLKKFNESLGDKELIEFCESYLAFLLDDSKFEIELVKEDGLKFIHLSMPLRETDGRYMYGTFLWSNIKDSFIPFLKMLELNYNIVDKKNGNNICFEFINGHRQYNLNQILNDNLRKSDRNIILRGIWVYNISNRLKR